MKAPQRSARGYFTEVGEGLVVAFDRIEVVQIVDHEPGTLREAGRRYVSEPVEPFQPRPVSEVKPGHRVQRLAGIVLRFEQEPDRRARQGIAQRLLSSLVPALVFEIAQPCAIARAKHPSLVTPRRRQPLNEAWQGRQ